ncbi:MFS transporter [Hydrogenobacter hydrogenophilus]|uniref:Predicted arabinose efflux permease, MFS family n=1 Tax=Hydrogenobacter hydrogenophilus TaxID=35835 RepID=A0A285P365_9AQUI|nr:MFS transporter [Hydrogenobacter hydrogenophilus]SNZ14311.1 Predicted arabinose efflux permease, MFS family [Hydrogenobacter hydrogenophilus]
MRFINTDLTCRLDSLPWCRFHTVFVLALGITWVLDAFEIVIVSAVLKPMSLSLGFAPWQSSLMVSGFLLGAILGSLLFGYLADRYGRKKIFLITLLLYSLGTFLTGFANSFETAFFFRVLAGAGIGGEFSAIHSAVDEFIPSRHRGKVDGIISSLWNLGSIMASLSAGFLLSLFDESFAWRFAFLLGGALALLIIFVRFAVPESPRWLLSKGRIDQAERIVQELEKKAGGRYSQDSCSIPIFEGSILDATKLILSRYRWRFLFSSSMSITILATYYGMITLIPVSFHLSSEDIPRILLVGSVGGLIGGILVALASDVLGRKITGTFVSFMSFLLSLLFLLSFNFDLTYLIYSFFAFSFASVAYVSATEIYPSYLRAYAIGLISVMGRLAGAISPIVLVSLASASYTYGIIGLSILWFFGFVSFLIWSIMGLEAKGKAIEEITS